MISTYRLLGFFMTCDDFENLTKDVEAIDRFHFGRWDSYKYLNYRMEAAFISLNVHCR